MSRPSRPGSAAVPRYARAFVVLFLTALIGCAVASVNAWPFSNWRLFSSVRTDKQTSWQAVAVDTAGTGQDYPIATMAQGFRGFGRIARSFPKLAPSRRNAICAAWLTGAGKRFGPGVELLRVYRLEWLVSQRRGDRAAAPRRTLTWICDGNGVHAPG